MFFPLSVINIGMLIDIAYQMLTVIHYIPIEKWKQGATVLGFYQDLVKDNEIVWKILYNIEDRAYFKGAYDNHL